MFTGKSTPPTEPHLQPMAKFNVIPSNATLRFSVDMSIGDTIQFSTRLILLNALECFPGVASFSKKQYIKSLAKMSGHFAQIQLVLFNSVFKCISLITSQILYSCYCGYALRLARFLMHPPPVSQKVAG